MGQGYSTTAFSNGAASIDVSELPDVSYEKSLCAARFMKTIRGRHPEGQVVVKIFVKPSQLLFPLEDYEKRLQSERDLIFDIPNALPFSKIVQTDRAVYLLRQYIYSNLYDRISTRPFLDDIERRWITFQLLCGLRDCHAKGIRHGDIKSENILATTWNWVYLTDFASFKPTYLPEDNPADFSFFFDTSGRRTCYLAPERFHHSAKHIEGGVTEAMDIFSLGCVIAEIFLEGTAVFNLSTLFKYKRGEFSPALTCLNKIEDPEIKNLILHMINPNPEQRLSANDYLSLWRRKVFPEYFYSFLHQYLALLTDPTSGQSQMSSERKNLGECDDRIDRIFNDMDKIAFFLGYDEEGGNNVGFSCRNSRGNFLHGEALLKPGTSGHSARFHEKLQHVDDGTLIFLAIVTSSIRNTMRSRARSRACDLLLAFGEHISDDAKIDRCLPYLIELVEDSVPVVRISALNSIVLLVRRVEYVSPANASVFQDYMLPKLAQYSKHYGHDVISASSALVRSAYAASLAPLAESASKFLDIARALRLDKSFSIDSDQTSDTGLSENIHLSYDSAKNDLISFFEGQATALLTDGESAVRRAFLPSVQRLCIFFGKSKSNDVLLSHLNTYLNDKDWMLKSAFFETIVGIAIFIGANSLEEYILPLMFQALSDPEEFVVYKVLWSLASMAQVGLFQRPRLWEITGIVAKLLIHPNSWIQEAARYFITASANWMDLADAYCILLPIVRPFLKSIDTGSKMDGLLDNTKDPIPRNAFDVALNWAAKADSMKFWIEPAENKHRNLSSNERASTLKRGSGGRLGPHSTARSNTGEDGEVLRSKLFSLGFKEEDEEKVLTLREHIWRVAHMRAKLNGPAQVQLNNTISLQSLKITPQTVFFDEKEMFSNTHPPFSIQNFMPPSAVVFEPALQVSDSRTVEDNGNCGAERAPPLGQPIDTAEVLTGTLASSGFSRSGAVGNRSFPSLAATNVRKVGHSYDGGDPYILELLYSLYLENYPTDISEFGPFVAPVAARQRMKSGVGPGRSGHLWKPEGSIVAQFSEHTAAINRIAVAPDHSFFVTGSDDGSVKVWDTARLERNFSSRSRQTHKHRSGAKVLTLCFVENTHCFVSCASDGSVDIVQVDVNYTSGNNRYSKLKVVRTYQLPHSEFSVWCEHFKSDAQSLLVLATNRSRVLGIDIRTMQQAFELRVAARYGGITCFCIDKKKSWLLLGTSDGIIVLWDLRFFLQLKAWTLTGSYPIHRLAVHPSKGRGKWVCVAGGNRDTEISVWDIEKMQCREIYRKAGDVGTGHAYEAKRVDGKEDVGLFSARSRQPDLEDAMHDAIRAVVVGVETIEDNSDSRGGAGFMVTSGSDGKIRFWDLSKGEASTVCSGLDLDEMKPSFISTRPTISLTLVTERSSSETVASNRHTTEISRKTKTPPSKPSRVSLISLQQQQLLRSHLDCVTDVAFADSPFKIIISADRSGSILVCQ